MNDWGFLFSRRDRKSILAIVFLIATVGMLYTIDPKSPEKTTIDFTEFKQRAEQHYQKKYVNNYKPSVQPKAKLKTNFTKQANLKISTDNSKVTDKNSPSLQADKASYSTPLNSISNSKINSIPKTRVKKEYYNRYRKYNQKLDVNASDVIDWEALPGIGPYYSKIITNFREKLGGFTSIEQVGETWRLPDSTFLLIKPYLNISAVFRKIDINLADEKTLSMHPYINWKEAKLIYNYRNEHGLFNSVEELNQIHAFQAPWLEKVFPYLEASLPTPEVNLIEK